MDASDRSGDGMSERGPRPPEAFGAAWGYRGWLDGLRAMAVYLVVLFHAGWAGSRAGSWEWMCSSCCRGSWSPGYC